MMGEANSFRLYGGWSDDLRASELATLRNIDAAAWLRTAVSLLRTDEPAQVKILSPNAQDSGPCFLRKPSGSECLIVRFLRYMSSEQLFALLLSAQDFLPYARFATKVRYQELTKAYTEIGEGLVPERFSRLAGGIQGLEDWLSVKLGNWNATPLCPSLIRFIKDEARFLSDRTFINAIKHGRARTQVGGGTFGLDVEVEGAWQPIIQEGNAIWVEDWSEDAGGFSHCAHVETFEFRAEIGAIHVAHLLMTAIIKGRSAYLEMLASRNEGCKIDVSLPCDIAVSAAVSRVKGLPVLFGSAA